MYQLVFTLERDDGTTGSTTAELTEDKLTFPELKEIKSIDFSQLSEVPDLKELYIEQTSIQSIDLSPISKLAHLEVLSLNRNRLTEVDLSPLSDCKSLRKLILSRNLLRTIDLEPLAECKEFRELDIRHSDTPKIDITSLFSCKNIETVRIDPRTIVIADECMKGIVDVPDIIDEWSNQHGIEWIPFAVCPICKEALEFGYLSAESSIKWYVKKPTMKWLGGEPLKDKGNESATLRALRCRKCNLIIHKT